VPRAEEHRLDRKVSIVILGFNQVEYTKKCIESIRAHTRQSYELILVDNGSRDGTEEYFRSVPGAKVIRNAENQGVAKGWNQGMRLAEGDYILIFNNDTIVGPGWLENMVRLCESGPSIGMVGPRSNYIAGPQIVKKVPYSTEAGIQEFIGKWQAEHALSASEFGFIKGFCLLIPRAVFRKVGFFDERFGKGNFEDDDYCMRVRCHGWRTLIAHDSFIHHYGSVSFNQESVDWKALMVENQRKYQEKWLRGIAAVEDTVVADPRPASAFPEGAQADAPAPRTAPTPAPQGGKAPSLPGIEEARKAFEAGDVAASRRLFLDVQARHPEHPEPYCGLGVIAFHDGSHRDAGNLFLTCLEFDPAHEDAAANLLDLFETLEGETPLADLESLCGIFPGNPVFAEALRKRGGSPAPLPEGGPAPLPEARPLEPWRADIEASIARRDFAPALDALESRLKSGRDASVCFNYMGVIAHACGDQAFAVENFRSALRNGPAEADAVFNLADTLLATGRAEEALRVLEEPPALVEADAGVDLAASAEQIRHAIEGGKPNPARLAASRDANHRAEALLRAGRPREAAAELETALREDASDFRALNNLALSEWYQGRAGKAFDLFRDCLRIRPAWPDALVNAFDAALASRRAAELRPLLDAALSRDPNHKEALRIRRHIEREGLALEACRSFDDLEADAELLGRAEKAMQEDRRPEAINLFLEAMERRARNPQALNGLGVIAFLEKRNVDAYALFDAAVALHPMDQDILVNLWQAAQSLRKEGEVLPRLKDSLERNPAMHDVKAILEKA
jgi:GT2 family glycosyltransferase/Flp pilus assembly protein TadD